MKKIFISSLTTLLLLVISSISFAQIQDWDRPIKQHQVKQKWNTNFQRSDSLKADLKTLDDGEVISDNSIEFNSDKSSKEVTLECKYYYTINGDYEIYNDFRIIFKFKTHIR